MRDHRTEHRGDRDLDDGPGEGDPPHGEEVGDREVDADPEHQQDDADLGKLLREAGVGDESWRVGADDDSRQQVADQRRETEPRGGQPEHERQANARGDRGYEGRIMRHALPPLPDRGRNDEAHLALDFLDLRLGNIGGASRTLTKNVIER
jgi:hypothetical protein